MSFFKRIFTHPGFHSGLFGTMIAGFNLYHIQYKKQQDQMSQLRYGMVSLGKGAAYGATYPFSLGFMLMDSCTGTKEFRRHLVPLSVYGGPEDHEEIDPSQVQGGCMFDISTLKEKIAQKTQSTGAKDNKDNESNKNNDS